jgi:uncharacterized RmlC-like cupin family protein
MHLTKQWSSRVAILVVATIALVVGATTVAPAATAATEQEPVRRVVYGQATPVNAPGQVLYLQRVTVDPGAKLPEHYHEGTQLATIRAGVLTYHVETGRLSVTHADNSTDVVDAPAVVKLRRGDTIVEPESLAHFAENAGKAKVVIDLAALLHDGAPLATPVGDATGMPMKLETILTSDSRTLVQSGPGNTITYGWNRLLGTATRNGGLVSVDMQASVQYTSGNGPFSGFVTFTFLDGSTLGVSMQGVTKAQANTADATFQATLGVIGGTGTYTNVKGSVIFTGTRQAQLGGQVQATFELDLEGIS